jgi:protocatechuate 3,4-dioxygenase alpha subunit
MSAPLGPTPAQTIGPFFAFGLSYPRMNEVAYPHSPGAITLTGTIRDGAGAPIPDALIEIFGADSDGRPSRERGSLRRDGRSFTGFGRAMTDDEGRYLFWTREPGSTEGAAPFFAVTLFARGLPGHVHTRIYVPGHDDALGRDGLLTALEPHERETLIATRLDDGHLRHDIHMQGERETVFLEY